MEYIHRVKRTQKKNGKINLLLVERGVLHYAITSERVENISVHEDIFIGCSYWHLAAF